MAAFDTQTSLLSRLEKRRNEPKFYEWTRNQFYTANDIAEVFNKRKNMSSDKMSEELAAVAKTWIDKGLNITLAEYDGRLIYKDHEQGFKSAESLRLRDDDILLCSFPKSGSHWTWEILNMIVSGKATYTKHWQNSAWIEARTEEELEKLHSPRVLRTQFQPRWLPDDLWTRRCKIVYVQRNPKDVAVSAFHQGKHQVFWNNPVGVRSWTGSCDNMVEMICELDAEYGTWFDHVLAYRDVPKKYPNMNICYVHYESMKEDCLREVKRLAEYLERPLSEQTCQKIVDACSFQNLKHAAENVKDQTYHLKWEEGSYFRKGIVGDWKNWFTVAQSERFDKIYEEKMNEKYPYSV